MIFPNWTKNVIAYFIAFFLKKIILKNFLNLEKIVTLDKLFFKILASDTDLDFQENLGIYLPKLIEKLATNEDIVRKKVMEILVHINKRVKSRPNVQLPIHDFLIQFNDSINKNQSFVTVSL